jgi:tetratricopeptide (TPR) repeat protein
MPSVGSGLFLLTLTLAAGKPGTPENTETIAQYADEMLAVGNTAEAVDWYSRIIEGGEPELGPQAALQIGVALVDDDIEASQAALRYAAEHGSGQVAAVAARNLQVVADHGIAARTAPATLEEVVGRAALGRGRIWAAANDLQGAIEAFDVAAGSPVADIAAEGLCLLGSALMMGGDQDAAVKVLNQAMASGHRRFGAMAAVDLAMILVDRGERDHASILLRQARDGDLAGTMAAVNLGVMLARHLGDQDRGISALRTAAQDQVPLIAAGGLFNLATLLEENGDRAGAEQAYRDAAELRQPMFSGKAAVNLALLLSRRMDTEGERAAYQLAAEVGDPNDQAQARKMLVLLGGLV